MFLDIKPSAFEIKASHPALDDAATILPFRFPTFEAAEQHRRYLVKDCGCQNTRTLPCYGRDW